MELLLEYPKPEKMHDLMNGPIHSNEKIISTIGRDFYKAVANINGLVSLLNDVTPNDPDFKQIHNYLSSEAIKLQFMVKDICSK